MFNKKIGERGGRTVDHQALRLFFSILIPASILLEVIYIIHPSQLLIFGLMWVPGLAAIITSKIHYRKDKVLGWQGAGLRDNALAVALPFVYLMLSYTVAWSILRDPTTGFGHLVTEISNRMPIILYVGLSLVFGLGAAAGEEIGWRGFFYPLLERLYGRTRAIIISAGIWGVWHLPLIISGHYQSATNLIYGLLMFMVGILMISVPMSWLRSVSGGVIPPILLHGAHNFFDQAVFSPLSTDPNIAYFAGEQGVFDTCLHGNCSTCDLEKVARTKR